MSKSKYKIPFSNNTMMEYTGASEGDTYHRHGLTEQFTHGYPSEWRENSVFEAQVRLTGTYRGRSAARIKCVRLGKTEHYSMGLSAFYEAVTGFGVHQGIIDGKWTFRKQGSNYGLYPVFDKE